MVNLFYGNMESCICGIGRCVTIFFRETKGIAWEEY